MGDMLYYFNYDILQIWEWIILKKIDEMSSVEELGYDCI